MNERVRELFDVVVQDPGNEAVAQELEALLTAEEEWGPLVDLYVHLAQNSAEPSRSSALLRSAGEVAELRLADSRRAVEIYGAAVDIDPEPLVLLGRMRVLLRLLEDWEGWVQVGEAEVERTADPGPRAELIYELGEVLEEKLGDQERAMVCYQAAFQADQRCLRALYAARRIYRQIGNWEMVAQLLDLEVQTVEDPDRQAEIFQELGNVLLYDLDQAEMARQCFERYLVLRPDDLEIQAQFAELGGATPVAAAEPAAASVVEDAAVGEAARSEPAGAALTASEGSESDSVDAEAPATAGTGEPDSVEAEGTNEPDSVEAEAHVAAGAVEPAVAAHADPLAAVGGNEPESVGAEAEPLAVVDGSEPDSVDTATFVTAGAGQADSVDADPFAAAASLGPDSVEVEVPAATEHGQPDSVEGNEPGSVEADPPAAPHALEANGEESVASEPVSTPSDQSSGESLDPVAGVAPEIVPIASSVQDVAAMQAIAEGGDAADRLGALAQLAGTADAVPGFAGLYLAAIRGNPGDVGVYIHVGRKLKGSLATSTAIAQGLEALAAEFPAAAHALKGERILFGTMHLDEGKATDLKLRELAKVSGDDAGAREWQIQRLIETGKWRNIQQMLTDAAGGDTPANRTSALRQMALLAETRSNEPDKATEFWRQVHLADKSDRDARRALARLYLAGEKWSAYVEILKLEVEEIPDSDREAKIEGLKSLIAVYTGHLNLDAMVVNLYNHVLQLDPADAQAMATLAEKYEAMRRWPDLVALLQKQVDGATGLTERVDLNLRIAHLYLDKFRNQAEAIKSYEAVLGDDPGNRTAIENLQDMYEKRREWEKLVAVQRQLADTETDPGARAAKYKEIADNATKKIRRPSISLELWEQVLSIQPGDIDALRALVGLYETEKVWDKMVEAATELVDRASDVAERVDLLQKAGLVLQDRIGDREGCVAIWQKLIAIEPEHRRAGESLKKALIELGDWQGLTEYFGVREKWDELVRLLDGQVGVQKDDGVKIDLLFRTATIFEGNLQQKDRAVRALERILQIEPRNVVGARALEPIYEAAHEYRKLATVLDVLLEHEEDPSERRQLMLRSAVIHEQHLRNPDAAFEWVRRVLQEHPTDAEVRTELERLGGLTHQWSTVHDDLVAALGNAAGETEAQLAITLTLARILDQNMGQVHDALARYHDALSIAPDNEVALDAVESLYTRLANWTDLLGVIDRKLALADGVSARKVLLRKQGFIFEEQLDDANSAVEKYRAIVDEDEGDREALQALHRLFQAGERFEELHEILHRELQLASLTGEGDVVAIKLERGFIELHSLGKTAEAVEAFQDILEANPQHPEARGALEGLLIDPEFRGRVAKILEPIYHDQGEWEALVRVLEIELDDSEETAKRFELLERIGSLHTARTADVERAFDAFARALREVPNSHVAVTRLSELAEVGQKFGELATLLEDVVPDVKDDGLARGLLARLAGIYDEQLGDLPRAIDAHTRVLNLEPDNKASIDSLERLYTRGEMWPELLAIYRRKLELTEDPLAREALLFQIGNLLEEMLGDAPEAIVTYREVLEADEQNVRALRALDRLYGNLCQWTELAEVIELQLALATDESARTALRVRLGALQEGELGNAAVAIESYRTVLATRPDNVEALAALERLLAEPAYQATIADILEPIYRSHDEWEKLIGVYEIQRGHADEESHQVELLHRIAELHQNRGGAPDQAFRSYARAFAVDPAQQRTLAELLRIAEALEIWGELVDVYEGQVDQIMDPVVATEIHKRVARVQLQHTRDLVGARRHYEAAYASDDTDLECLAALEDIYFQTEQWAELVAVLLRKSELTEDVDAKKDLLFRVSAIYEEMLDDAHRAVEIYRAVLEVDAIDARALDALERIFLTLARWEDLLEILHRKAELTDDIAARKDIYYVIGAAYDRELDDLTRAVETYQTILGWDARDLTSLQCLDSLYHRLERWEDLLGILEREVAVVSEPEAQVALHFRIANLHEVALENVEQATAGYRDILSQWPHHEPSLAALEGLIRTDRDAVKAVAVLEPVLKAAGGWERLIGAWRSLLEVTSEQAPRTALRMEIGDAFENMLVDSDQAFEAFADAFREDPTHEPALVSLERVARNADGFDRLVTLIEEQLGNVTSDGLARDLYLRVARLHEEELGSNVDAIERYRRVLEIESDHEGAVHALDRLYQKEGMWSELAEILRTEVTRAEDAATRIPVLLRLGSLDETALDDIPAAIQAYKDVLLEEDEQPDAVSALVRLFDAGHERPQIGEILQPLYLERQDWAHLHGVLEALLPFKEPGDDRTQHLHQLAELSLEKLGSEARAFDWYAVSFKETPEDELGRRELSRLAGTTERYSDLVVTFTEGMHRTQDAELLRSLAHEMAVVYRTKLGEDESAERMYRYILEIDPVDAAALAGLDELYVQQHRWTELVEILRREISATYDEAELLGYMFRLGQVYETWLTELDLAVEQYRGILEQEPHHLGALGRLEQIYQAREEWEPLFDICNRQSEVAEHDAEKALLFARMAELASAMLSRPEDAIDLWNKVVDLKGEDPAALRALESLYEGQERWRELVDVCDRQVNLPDNSADREIELFSKLGRVWGDYLDRERNALENWNHVLTRDPLHEPALWAIRSLHERTADFAELAQADHRLLDLLAGHDSRRIDLFRQLGELYQKSLENPGEAVRAWGSVLALAPQDADAIDALEALYTAAGDWRACVEILDRKADITPDPFDKSSILFSVAEMWEKKIGEADGAKRAYGQVLELQPSNLDASQELERLYEADMQWEELVGLLLQRLETTTDAFEREELFKRTANVFETRLMSIDNAFVVLSKAFEEIKDDDRLGAELERLAGLGDKWGDFVQLYEGVLHGMGHVQPSVALHLRVATVYDRELRTPEHAGTHYQYILAIEPENLKALDALQNLLERYNKWPEVVTVLQRRAELSLEPDERKAALEKMARILEERLERTDAAIDAWRQVMAIDDTEMPTLQALGRLYAVRERWQDLINILGRETQVIYDSNQIVENHLRIGELYEGRLGNPERAIDAYRQALSVDDRCLDAMTALEKLYTAQDRWRDLLDVFEMMLNVKTEPAQQLLIYGRIAIIQEEELGDRMSTIDTFRKMLMVDPANTPAVRSLERLYRDGEQWHDLADVYRQHLEALKDDRARVQIYSNLAALYRGPLADPYAAIDNLTPILAMDSRNLATLTALGELYAQVEDWPNCIDALSREAHLLTERPLVLDRQYRVGQVFETKVGDLDQAERWYKSALEHDPAYLPALNALKGVHEQRAEWPEVVRTLKMIEAATKSFPEKGRSLFEIGQVYEKYLGDRGAAIDYYEQAMDMHPESVDAAAPLVEVYLVDRRWERAEPLLDLIITARTAANADVRELQTLNYRLGFVAEQLHKDEKAIAHYKTAYELDSTHLPTLQGMGNLLFRREDWDRAFKIYQTILVHHRENLSEPEVVEIFYRQGQIKLKVGERRKALDFFKKGLDIEPRSLQVLRAVVDLHEKQGDWEDVIHYRRQLLVLDTDANERFTSLVTIGDILREHLRNVAKAVDAYKEALGVQADSRLVLSKLLDLYQEARQWNEAVEILTRLAELERDLSRQSKYYYTIGVIQRDELKDNFQAVRTLDKALDADPAMLKSFQAIDQILTNERDYERQDRYYRKMLKRAMESKLDDKLVITLAKGLGEINRTRLKKYEEAIKAYKIALTKSPEDLQVHTIVAELFELNDQPEKAIAEHYKMIELNPRNVESYQQVRRLFMEAGRYDEAWCVCQVLSYLGHANADERAFFEKYRSKTLTQARKSLDNEQWGLIYHPELSLLLAQFFQRLYQYTVPLMAQQHKDLKLHKKKDVVEPTEQTPFNNVLNYVTQVTRLHRVEVYRIPDAGNGIFSANLNPPAVMVGGDVLSGRSLQELAFITAKQLMMMGQHFYTATIDATYERRKGRLSTIVYTVMKLVSPGAEVPFKDDDLLESFRAIPQADLQEISKIIGKMSENQQQHLNLSKWLEMVEHTGNRLGFVLSNDLGAAVRCIKNEPGQFSKAPVQDRVREVVLYALSENYFKLRKALGLAIG